ncbi:MAG: hypothetical protein AAF191_08400, partial [Verrucomicrobiota bacterium]
MSFFWSLFLEVTLPIALLILAGASLGRTLRIDLRSLVKLTLYLFVPAFVFVRLLTSSLTGSEGAAIMGFTVLMIASLGALCLLIGYIFRFGAQQRRCLQLSTMFYNCGNFGIPATALAFPPLGPVVQAFVLTTMNVSTFTLGLLLAQPSKKASSPRSLLTILRQPS